MDAFNEFAMHCSNVTDLEVKDAIGWQRSEPPPPGVFPRLKSFAGEPRLLAHLSPGRPVETIKISFECIIGAQHRDDPWLLYKEFADNAPGLKALSCFFWSPGPGQLRPVAMTLPNLEALGIHCGQYPCSGVSSNESASDVWN